MVRLAEILDRINELFADEDFNASGIESWVQGVVTVLGEDPQIRLQAAANSRTQFVESPDLSSAVTDAVLSNHDTHNNAVDFYFTHTEKQAALVKLLGELVHENLRIEREEAAAS
jgi:type I restriction enzyme R subunit